MHHNTDQYMEEIMLRWMEEMKAEDEMTEKQRRILEASIKLFAEKGFHASSTSEIAKAAGVAEGTIFRHFKTKKDILLALIIPAFMKFLSPYILKDIIKIFSDPNISTEVLLQQLFKNRLELIEKNWERVRIIFQEATFHSEIKEALIEHVAKRARGLAEGFITKKIDEGEFRNLPPLTVTRAFFSLMLGFVVFKHIAFPEEMLELDQDKEIELTIDIFLNGVLKRD